MTDKSSGAAVGRVPTADEPGRIRHRGHRRASGQREVRDRLHPPGRARSHVVEAGGGEPLHRRDGDLLAGREVGGSGLTAPADDGSDGLRERGPEEGEESGDNVGKHGGWWA